MKTLVFFVVCYALAFVVFSATGEKYLFGIFMGAPVGWALRGAISALKP